MMPTLRLCPQWRAETSPVISRAFKASWGSCSGPLWIEVPGQRGPRATVPVTSNDSIHPWLITPWTRCGCTAPLPSSSPLALQFAWGLVPFDRQGTEPLFMNHHLCASYAAKCRTGIISLGLCISSVRWAPIHRWEHWKLGKWYVTCLRPQSLSAEEARDSTPGCGSRVPGVATARPRWAPF